jgi:hypothetical protein
MVLKKHRETAYFYIDFYDNKLAKTKFNGITYGMDIINAGNSRISEGDVTSLSGADEREVRDNREKW